MAPNDGEVWLSTEGHSVSAGFARECSDLLFELNV